MPPCRFAGQRRPRGYSQRVEGLRLRRSCLRSVGFGLKLVVLSLLLPQEFPVVSACFAEPGEVVGFGLFAKPQPFAVLGSSSVAVFGCQARSRLQCESEELLPLVGSDRFGCYFPGSVPPGFAAMVRDQHTKDKSYARDETKPGLP